MDGKFNVKNFKDMLDLREGFAQRRFKEKIVLCDHQFGNSDKLATKKHGFKRDGMGLQDHFNEKQHQRKMEQIGAINRQRS